MPLIPAALVDSPRATPSPSWPAWFAQLETFLATPPQAWISSSRPPQNPLMPVLLERVIDLQPGEEWYSDPFETHPGRSLHLYAIGTIKFYMTAVNTARFDQLRESGRAGPGSPNPWPFSLGVDRSSHDEFVPISIGGPYRLIVRLGVFNPAGRVRVRVSED